MEGLSRIIEGIVKTIRIDCQYNWRDCQKKLEGLSRLDVLSRELGLIVRNSRGTIKRIE